jgi:UDP-glucose 4-epimerase
MRVLVTGGAGYIGTHLVVDLLKEGHDVAVLDNFSTGHIQGLERAQVLAGRSVQLFYGDIADATLLRRALRGTDLVFHLAGSKQVGESMQRPEFYFKNNVGGMIALLSAMQQSSVSRIVYSSSAAVYGPQPQMPLTEDAILSPESPYGLSKAQGEQCLGWMAKLHGWSAVSLRYFNPVGAHSSGHIGEPFERAASLVPRALKVLTQEHDPLTVFGTDYDTPDGTCLRDYIHICDLSRAHIAAMAALERPGHHVYNVGTGHAYSVREVLEACQRVTGQQVPHVFGDRRPGDMPVAIADPARFRSQTGFMPWLSLDKMIASAWRWWQNNPTGYASPSKPSQSSGMQETRSTMVYAGAEHR